MEEDDVVECCNHGPQPATFVCQHLAESVRTGRRVGFHCASGAGRSDAWCDACERVRALEGGWTDRSEGYAGITLLCGACYDVAHSVNTP